jgi:hypothetical protein
MWVGVSERDERCSCYVHVTLGLQHPRGASVDSETREETCGAATHVCLVALHEHAFGVALAQAGERRSVVALHGHVYVVALA